MNIHDATEEAYKRGKEDGKPKWIPVTERLPELEQYIYSVDVMFYVDGEGIRLGFVNLESGNWKCRDSRTIFQKDYVTHWMPLPEPPREVER